MLVIRTGDLLLVPIYWRLLSPDDYGLLAIITIVKAFLSAFLGLGLQDSITRFYYAWPPAQRRVRLGSVWMLDWTSSILIGTPIVLLGGPAFALLIRQVAFHPYLQIATVIAILNSLALSPLITLRITEQAGLYVFCSALTFVSTTALTILLVAGLQRGVLGVLQAQLASSVLMATVYAIIMVRRARPNFRKVYWGEALRYSLPLVPVAIIEAFSVITDRFILEKSVSLSDLGYYSVADQMARGSHVFNRSLKTTWIPFQMRTISEHDDGPNIVGRMATYFVLASVVVALALAAVSRDLITLIGVAKYEPVAGLLPFAVLPYILLSLAMLTGQGIALALKTQYTWIVSLATLSTSIILGFTLIPIWGIYGAFATTIGAALVRLLVAYSISQRMFPIPFRWGKIGVVIVGAALTFVLTRLVSANNAIAGLLVRGAIVASFAGLVGYFLLGGRTWIRAKLAHWFS